MKKEQREFFTLLEEFRKLNISSMLPNIPHGDFCIMKTIHDLKTFKGQQTDIRVSDIVETMQAPPPAISRGLRSLEERGLIKRSVDERDRRNTFVELTAEGQKLSDELDGIMEDFVDAVFVRMGAEPFEELNRNLKLMVQVSQEEIAKRKYQNTHNIEKKGE